MTQKDLILKYMLKNGSITQREAMFEYSIQSFHKRLSELREDGWDIIGELRAHPVTKQEYTRYYFGSAAAENEAIAHFRRREGLFSKDAA